MMTLTYREVTGLWSARVPDGPDSDAHPDTVLLEGHVTFEPQYRVPLVYPGEHIVVEPMHAVIHEGVLYGETVVGDDVVRGSLFLPVTVDDAANQSWSWVAKFQGMRLGEYGEEVSLPSVRFQVPAGGDALDLSEVIPVSQSGNTITLRGPGLSEEDAQALVDAGLDERGLLPDGSLPSVARAEVEQIVAGGGLPDGVVPIFPTLAEALAWEADNPGRTALTLEPSTPDTTPPSPGVLTVEPGHVSADLTVSGASDDRAVTGYAFRVGSGAWSAWQAEPTFTAGGLSAATSYAFQHRVRDAAGNEATGTAVSATTTANPPADWGAYDVAVQDLSPHVFLPLMSDAIDVGSSGTTFTNNGGTFGSPIAGTTGVRLAGGQNITSSLSSIPAINGEGTFSLIVMPATSMAGVGRILGSDSARMDLYAMRPTTQVRTTAGDAEARPAAAIDTGTAHHLTGTVTAGGVVTTYVNGYEAATGQASGALTGGLANFSIGTETGKASPHQFDGTITRAAMWTRALTPAEVRDLAEKAGF